MESQSFHAFCNICTVSSTGFSINEMPEEDLKRKPTERRSQESCPCLDRDRRWMEDTLSDLCSREGDKRGERKAARLRPADRVICVSCKQTREKAKRKRTSTEASREENNEWIRDESTHWPPCLLSFFSSGLRETPLRSQTGPPACSECLSYSEQEKTLKVNMAAVWQNSAGY